MPTIIPIRDLRNTSEISDLAHRIQEPIFITKNGYSDLEEIYPYHALEKLESCIAKGQTDRIWDAISS